METKYKKIWQLALPYLRKGKRKDFVLHTKGVVKAMEMILKKERGDKNILIPAAILHDVGWAEVSEKIQISEKKSDMRLGLKLHLDFAPEIIDETLSKNGYTKKEIKEITEIVKFHQLHKPRKRNKLLLIDADNLSDIFKEQFYSDAKSYKNNPKDFLEIRKRNKFHTKTARKIFYRETKKREKESKKLNSLFLIHAYYNDDGDDSGWEDC
jgi:HD superfamily phosphodiesterase